MVLCELGRAAALGSIPVLLWTGHLAMAWLYAAALVEGTLFVFFTLALTACLPMVVGPGQLGEAAAQNYAAGSVAALIGPILGGGLYQLRRLLPFLADATSYAVSLTSLLFIRVRFQETRIATARDLRQEIREGLAWLWDHAVIRAMAFLAMGYWVAYAGMPLILIVLARRNMHASPAAIGLLLGVGAAGGIVGSLLAPAIGRRLRFGRAMIGYVWLMTILWGACAAAPDLPILAVLVTVLFLVTPTGDVLQFSYRLALIPDSLQGRVNSVFRLIGWSGRPVGLALAGALAQRLGPDAALLATAAGGIVLALATTLSRSVRTAR
jgi:predicted MFS family arabinose efflux permease